MVTLNTFVFYTAAKISKNTQMYFQFKNNLAYIDPNFV